MRTPPVDRDRSLTAPIQRSPKFLDLPTALILGGKKENNSNEMAANLSVLKDPLRAHRKPSPIACPFTHPNLQHTLCFTDTNTLRQKLAVDHVSLLSSTFGHHEPGASRCDGLQHRLCWQDYTEARYSPAIFQIIQCIKHIQRCTAS